VGLDVVKTNLEKINGKIDVKSKLGHGTTFRLSLPLSAAITDGIVVKIESNQYILPIYSIRELVQVPASEVTHLMNGDKVVKIRENLFPVLSLDRALGEIKKTYEGYDKTIKAQRRSDHLTFVILETLHGVSCFPVDEILGQAQVVVKTVHMGANIPEVGGAAIMGDGRTVLILDPTAITANQLTTSLERQVAV
jgi:two-component system chemotaxis sensor kinase CheA